MKCYICHEVFGQDGSDCPGCCTHEACQTAIEMPGVWEEFLKVKEQHIARVMREASARGERPYIHMTPRREE